MTINECIEKYVYKEKIKSEELKKFCSEIILCDDFIYKNIIKSLRFASIFSNANGYVDKQCNIFINIKKTMRTNNKTHLRLFHLFTALYHTAITLAPAAAYIDSDRQPIWDSRD